MNSLITNWLPTFSPVNDAERIAANASSIVNTLATIPNGLSQYWGGTGATAGQSASNAAAWSGSTQETSVLPGANPVTGSAIVTTVGGPPFLGGAYIRYGSENVAKITVANATLGVRCWDTGATQPLGLNGNIVAF